MAEKRPKKWSWKRALVQERGGCGWVRTLLLLLRFLLRRRVPSLHKPENVKCQKVEKSSRNRDALIRVLELDVTLLWPKKGLEAWHGCPEWVAWIPARVGPFPPPPRRPPVGTAAAPPLAPLSGRSNQTPDTQTPGRTHWLEGKKGAKGGVGGGLYFLLVCPEEAEHTDTGRAEFDQHNSVDSATSRPSNTTSHSQKNPAQSNTTAAG